MNTQQTTDERFMRRCLQLAANGLLTTKPNPMVGAVIVSADGRIIGEGFTSPVGGPHAEVNAFASVKPADEPLLPGATIYVSLEPCSHWGHTPPCCDLIIRKRVKRCVCGCVDPFAKVQGRGISRMREAGIEVTVGVLEAECKAINRRFMTFNELHRPYIILKWAQTANGYMAQSDRQPLRISTPFTMMLSHKLRSECDAILVGRTTFDTDHPQLTVRDWTGPNPERLVLTHRAINDAPASSLSPSASSSPSTPSTPLNPSAPLAPSSASPFLCFPNIDAVIAHLTATQRQSLIVEGGPTVHQQFLDRGLWDELRVETAPFTIPGGISAPRIPDNAIADRIEQYDENIIRWYHR